MVLYDQSKGIHSSNSSILLFVEQYKMKHHCVVTCTFWSGKELCVVSFWLDGHQLIPNHQFGFRQRPSTIEQTHRIVQWINEALEHKQYCSAAFLYITQVLDKYGTLDYCTS
jgi:hypothetical protein